MQVSLPQCWSCRKDDAIHTIPYLNEIGKKDIHVTHAHPSQSVTCSVMCRRAEEDMIDVSLRLQAGDTGPGRDVVKIAHRLGIKPDHVATYIYMDKCGYLAGYLAGYFAA
jgi:hypothetical protein